MLKRIAVFVILTSAIIQFSACKKESPSVGFSTSQVSLDAINGPTTALVNINLSKSTSNIIDLYFEMEGPDTLQFGTTNTTFLNDDSNRISGTLGAIAFVDTPHTNNYISHVTIPYNTSTVALNITALFDNFPKRAVSYKIKMTQANNANISGNSELTINIGSTPMTPLFSGQLIIPQPNGPLTYSLSGTNFSPVGGGKWDFDLNYTLVKGSDSLQSFTVSMSNITPLTGHQIYIDDTGIDTVKTNFTLSPTPSSVRGNYYMMADQQNSVKVFYKDSVGLGDLQSTFVLF